ncbi:unnamed protein product [Nippostrongylus brasiliensis]|uniref:Nucleolar pre-ribosomal-associated protein 1 (inferred by orthology to a human protein) n=1 Tax=Nippostrongylus brasiliensis TaxID=27835 RepID=A0A0N4YR52_NIPBR|nr:unnamed protein product [Nippostrongylus brasiliensis]
MSTSSFLRQKGLAWNSLARAFDCEDEITKDDAVMNELLNLCSFWSDKEPIFKGPNDDSDSEDDSDGEDFEAFEQHVAMLASTSKPRVPTISSETLSCLSKSPPSFNGSSFPKASSKKRSSPANELENAFRGIVEDDNEFSQDSVFSANVQEDDFWSQLKYRQFIEANGLALAFSCTSSKDVAVRKLAYCVLQKFLSLMQELNIESAEDKYKILYIYIIRLLKQSIQSDAPRLPHVISHFFARLSKLILHPESPVFTAVLSFLILKPVMELDQVPELYKMLLSSSVEHHHQEREWILTLISESLIEPADYTIIQNRSGFKLMLSLFPTAMVDMTARRLILAILKTAVQMRSVAHDLFHRMNLHTWIACVIKDRSLTTWEQCYLGQIYCILIEMERKYCRQAQVGDDDTKRSSLVAATTVRLTSRQVCYLTWS